MELPASGGGVPMFVSTYRYLAPLLIIRILLLKRDF